MVNKVDMEYSSDLMEEYLTEDELEEYMDNLRTKVPSFIIELLKNNLKNRRLTREQLDKIVNRVTDLYFGKKSEDKTKELTAKINDLSSKLDALMKVAAISSATKVSEDIKKELGDLEEESSEEEIKTENPEEVEKTEEKVEGLIEEKEEIKPPEPESTPEAVEEEKEPVVEEKPVKKEKEEKEEIKEKELQKAKEENIKEVHTGEEVIIMPSDLTPVTEEKYRLEELPEDTVSTMLAFKWLEFLTSRVGSSNLIDTLDYYYNLKWISSKVVSKLIKISKNLKYFHEDLNWKPTNKMTPEDHVVSLLYIEKLGGRPVPMDELESVEREITRIKKWSEELQNL
ncbi:FlaD/FlaE family flagellar protein [Methanothermococcus thermolithotrophicus]|jgi:flagellar protein FlaD|uniref:FlaD n=1 Tax=Methanothermococcus thermolithotrophicus TaxID=2186 RepID=Q9C4P7_METTL|nr:FlaD/FlaE family flagellar protein [Methanothermococcus thermolithotrophicus]AAG50073.1 FlaD [Methanothermococcus thermolithotrophicus]MDK2987737.1 archaeal flagellar protein FlaD [Methanothermococcus sp.]